MSDKRYRCWHFATADMKLGNGDGRTIRRNQTLTVKGKPKCCFNGLHGSLKIMDALKYARGPMLCEVDIWGDVDVQDDKLCGTHRKTLNYANFEPWLRLFARWCALRVIHLWDAPAIVVRYLLTGDDAIRSAAWSAAGSAARAAAGDAARYAAWSAAGSAAWAAAGHAAWSAARDAQARQLHRFARLALAGKPCPQTLAMPRKPKEVQP